MFKVINKNTRRRCEIYSKLTIKSTERRQVLISHFFSRVSIVNFEQVNVSFSVLAILFGTKYSIVDQVKFVEESLKKLKGYGLLKQTYPFKFFKGYLPNFTWSTPEYFVPFYARDAFSDVLRICFLLFHIVISNVFVLEKFVFIVRWKNYDKL